MRRDAVSLIPWLASGRPRRRAATPCVGGRTNVDDGTRRNGLRRIWRSADSLLSSPHLPHGLSIRLSGAASRHMGGVPARARRTERLHVRGALHDARGEAVTWPIRVRPAWAGLVVGRGSGGTSGPGAEAPAFGPSHRHY